MVSHDGHLDVRTGYASTLAIVPSTVLIATPEHLTTLKQQDEFAEAQAFTDAEALRALDAITRQRPAVVALDSVFATTSRGAALMNRIKADPSLSTCEIRVLGADQITARAPARNAAATTTASSSAAVAELRAPAATADALDVTGTRRAPRVDIVDDIEVLIDGNPAGLVDLSTVGAMVLSPTILRPNQRVRVSLPDAARQIRITAVVAWASFELLKSGPRYRAGIEFFDADADAVQKFMDANKKS
jgi:CheY-like chemotaxis protein